MSTAVASHSQRNQATLPGHLIFIPVFKVFNRLAKASGFCLYFLLSPWSKATPPIVVSLPQRLFAQEDVEVYHFYKFYKEDSDLLEWFAEPTDSAVIAQATGGWRRAANSEYQLRMLGYAPRGVSYYESKYLFERVEISSTNSRLLSKLGLRGEYRHDGNYLRSTHHSFHDRVLYGRDHLVGANFSGRNYLMALSSFTPYIDIWSPL